MKAAILLLVLPALALTACSRSSTPPHPLPAAASASAGSVESAGSAESAGSPEAGENGGIDWFQGSIDQAFARAARDNKPVYLYWGASWCPPCQEIKATVFKDPDFLALSRLFVPVYIDGDSERAQQAGERFGVRGYPTMIVFNPRGLEITRIPGGIDIARYNSVLQLSLEQMRPVADLVRLALDEPASLSAKDFVQLAYYSWGQDFEALPAGTPPSFFRDLANRSPDALAGARLYMQYLASVQDTPEGERPPLDAETVDRLRAVLDSDELTLGCWDTLAYRPELVDLLVTDDTTKAALAERWQEQILRLRHDPSLSVSEQLAGWLPYLHFQLGEDGAELAPAVRTQLEADLSRADRVTTDTHARQSVVSQIEYIYQQAGMQDEATKLLLAELETSAEPYYFMSGLGVIAEKEGNNIEAVEWYRRAYEASRGEATRLQWGASYIRALIRMTPEDEHTIEAATAALLNEVDQPAEVFSGRNFRVLRSLERQLGEWQAKHAAQVAANLRSQIGAMCASLVEGSVQRDNCLSLAAASPTG